MDGKTGWPLNAAGIWMELRVARGAQPRPALFLDRDGVLIEDTGFVSDPLGVRLLPGAAELVAAANSCGMVAAMVTNQSGVDRGLFGWNDFAAVNRRMDGELTRYGARLDAIAACPFHPDFTTDFDDAKSRWRKPGPGMIEALSNALNLDRRRSWLVGDGSRDIESARAAGLAGAIRLCHDATAVDMMLPGTTDFPVREVADLAAARALLDDKLFRSASR